ncbi:MAG TPA: L-threonylcarbamoyladenylate synthase [Accumulibacter sp.]|nr:L-threonylcarbamoyladenylate synthase [Accumulibacter sp.]HMW16916.1 L-threonylcarbamoyladenylate synthase [Accumulibacter sp.]HMX21466.1 L-threonylcarbamoyladenylate synthase [Accumulibacter sp.]HMY06931.1 L-threonylcarbamoyladenylate synthase [Accumulibacter sp.]HNC18738.1 L-threonylcarbamoyladenylate synthase [Accumulibacter sp.]
MMPADPAELDRAVAALRAGELVAFPTETVYGLGADAANPLAVAKIFAAKGRPADHPLIVHLPGADYLAQWAREIPPMAWELAEAFWPGPLTLILKRAHWVPDAVTGGQDSVGVRLPAHPLALDLLRAYAAAGGGRDGLSGIAAPSANRFGRISPTKAKHVREELGEAVKIILDGGRCPVGIESTILDLTVADQAPRLLRPGHLSPETIAQVIGIEPTAPEQIGAGTPRVSGSLAAHYAPQTPLRTVVGKDLGQTLLTLLAQGQRCGVLCRHPLRISADNMVQRVLPDEPAGYAFALYAALRELDGSGVDQILVEEIPATAAWRAIADRLTRAAYGSGGQSPT